MLTSKDFAHVLKIFILSNDAFDVYARCEADGADVKELVWCTKVGVPSPHARFAPTQASDDMSSLDANNVIDQRERVRGLIIVRMVI